MKQYLYKIFLILTLFILGLSFNFFLPSDIVFSTHTSILNCPVPHCGDNFCDPGESIATGCFDCYTGYCPAPPPPKYCGDNICNNNESCYCH